MRPGLQLHSGHSQINLLTAMLIFQSPALDKAPTAFWDDLPPGASSSLSCPPLLLPPSPGLQPSSRLPSEMSSPQPHTHLTSAPILIPQAPTFPLYLLHVAFLPCSLLPHPVLTTIHLRVLRFLIFWALTTTTQSLTGLTGKFGFLLIIPGGL